MSTNKKLLSTSIKYLAWALPLLFIGPSLIYNAFVNKQNILHYLVLGIGIATCIGGVYLLFLGLKTMMGSLFND
jgi:hypothetical protein